MTKKWNEKWLKNANCEQPYYKRTWKPVLFPSKNLFNYSIPMVTDKDLNTVIVDKSPQAVTVSTGTGSLQELNDNVRGVTGRMKNCGYTDNDPSPQVTRSLFLFFFFFPSHHIIQITVLQLLAMSHIHNLMQSLMHQRKSKPFGLVWLLHLTMTSFQTETTMIVLRHCQCQWHTKLSKQLRSLVDAGHTVGCPSAGSCRRDLAAEMGLAVARSDCDNKISHDY